MFLRRKDLNKYLLKLIYSSEIRRVFRRKKPMLLQPEGSKEG
jgi:hypothetical protein